MHELFKGNCLGLQKFLSSTASIPDFFTDKSNGDFSSWHCNSELGGLVGVWGPSLLDLFPVFVRHIWVWDHPIPCLCPSYQSQCGFFFNSVVVGFLFSSVSDSSGWWLFYSLIVILMWLCKEAKCVYLCCHLDQKSLNEFDYVLFDNSIPDLYFPIKYWIYCN